MTEPPRPIRFQIHLSTAIVLMFVAGGLVWANVVGQMRNVDAESDGFGSQVIEFSLFHGWPCCVIAQRTARIDGPNVFKTEINKIWGEFSIASAIIDLTVALLFLASVWFLCEWLIRRSAARKEA